MRFVYANAIALLALVVACRGDTTSPSARPATSHPPALAPTPVALGIAPDSLMMTLGDSHAFSAFLVMSDGSRLPTAATWWSPNFDVITIHNGRAAAVGPGVAVVHAAVQRLTATARVVVLRPTSFGVSEALVVEAFSMVEFQYPSEPGHWYYAPQVRVRAAPGRTATVLRLEFSIPSFGRHPPIGCVVALSGTVARELNGEAYGDWAFTVDSPGHRAAGDSAVATIAFVDDAGRMATLAVTGPIVPGAVPATYGGDSGACFYAWSGLG